MKTTLILLASLISTPIMLSPKVLADDREKAELKKKKTDLLAALVSASKTYEPRNVGKPATKVEDVAPYVTDKEFAATLKKDFNFSLYGKTVGKPGVKHLEEVMVYENTAPKNGGLVLLYNGTVKTVTAEEFAKLVKPIE